MQRVRRGIEERTCECDKGGRHSRGERAVAEGVTDKVANRESLHGKKAKQKSARASYTAEDPGGGCRHKETHVADDDGDESAAALNESRVGPLQVPECDERAQRSDCERAEGPNTAGKGSGARSAFAGQDTRGAR